MSRPVAIVDKETDKVTVISDTEEIVLSSQVFQTIREGVVFYEGLVISPSSIIEYCTETNPRLIGAEVTIEKDKIRRKNQNKFEDMMKYVVPIAVLFIAAAIAYKMISSGDVQGAASSVTSSLPSGPIIK